MKKLLLIAFLFAASIFTNCAQFSKLLDFSSIPSGSGPYGSFISDGTFLYGMTYFGGANDLGVIFKIMPDGSSYSKLLDFSGPANGSNPYGSLFYDGTFLYGMTRNGGTNSLGVIFKIMPDGSGFTKLLDFSGTLNGANPRGSLIPVGNYLYGTTSMGGTNNMGVVFKIMPNGTGFSKLLDFSGTANGNDPFGSLYYDGTFLYGMTALGGTGTCQFNCGVLFKIMPDGSGFSKLLDFAGVSNGSHPRGSLISDGIFLYGMTQNGGNSDMGVIFKIMADGSGYSKLFDFSGTADGSFLFGSIISSGLFLYGVTSSGGANGMGTIFKIKSDGSSFSKLFDFSGLDGANPYCSLFSDGSSLYGMSSSGGMNGNGIIFKYQLLTTGIEKTTAGAGVILYPNPGNGVVTLQLTAPDSQISALEIYNVTGEKVFQSTINNYASIDLSLQPVGIYSILIKSGEKVFHQKIIKIN